MVGMMRARGMWWLGGRMLSQEARRCNNPRSAAVVNFAGGEKEEATTLKKEKTKMRAMKRLKCLYEEWGGGAYTIGERITMLQHSAQAGKLARDAGERPEAVVAALFHDVGHALGFEAGLDAEMDGCGFEAHDVSGGEFLLSLGFKEDVGYLTKQHVRAKRYLVAKDPTYELSQASLTTLGYQGGPMTCQEIAEADADPRWPAALRLRSYDEAAKDDSQYVGSDVESIFAEFAPEIDAAFGSIQDDDITYVLSQEQLRKWDRDGTLLVPNAVSFVLDDVIGKAAAAAAGQSVETALDDMANFLASVNVEDPQYAECLVHRELVGDSVQICRVENFAKREPRWRRLCLGLTRDLVSQVYREQAVLFKDKINFKGPGGAGFLWHQDATAYATDELATRHVSALIAVDPATVANGALQIVPAAHNAGIFPHTNGVIDPAVADHFPVQHVLAKPGDVVLFDSYLPHKSDPNTTDFWRRSAYITYNKLSEGDFHTDYYAKKALLMQQGAISINLDFAGKIID